MTETILLIIIILQLVAAAFRDYLYISEKKKLINALASRTPQDMATLEATDKLKVGVTEVSPPELTSLDEVPQEEWEKAVLGNGK